MANDFTSGFKEIEASLKDLPNQIRVSAVRAAARKAAKPIIAAARADLSDDIVNTEGQSKAAYIQRNIKAITLRSKENPGVYVGVKGKDFPVGDRNWDPRAYAILLGEGSYKTGQRKTRGTGANRGKFKGVGNFIQNGADAAGSQPTEIMINGIDEEVRKALDRAIRKAGG